MRFERNGFSTVLASILVFASAVSASAREISPSECRRIPDGWVREAGVNFEMPVASNEIKIMQYSVENLFDVEHDSGKEDFEFLPMASPFKSECANITNPTYRRSCEQTDWNSSRLALKISQIKRAVSVQGELPDILALEEVENPLVVRMVAEALGYPRYFVAESRDARGIDVALLFRNRRLNYLSHRQIPVGPNSPVMLARPTRDILAVYFSVQGSAVAPSTGTVAPAADQTLAVYVNHWPSQGNPSENRIMAAEALRDATVQDRLQYGAGYHLLAMGDFNTIATDAPHPFTSIVQNPGWSDALLDAQELYEGGAFRQDPDQLLGRMAPGTYFFRRDFGWNRLDRIFASQNLHDSRGMDLIAETFRIVSVDSLSKEQRSANACPGFQVPKEYDHNTDDFCGSTCRAGRNKILNLQKRT